MRVSSRTGDGLDKLWLHMKSYHQTMIDAGELSQRRDRQVSRKLCTCALRRGEVNPMLAVYKTVVITSLVVVQHCVVS